MTCGRDVISMNSWEASSLINSLMGTGKTYGVLVVVLARDVRVDNSVKLSDDQGMWVGRRGKGRYEGGKRE